MEGLLILLGSLAGAIIASLIGLGGGVVMVPILTILFGFDIRVAIPASLLAVIGTSLSASSRYIGQGIVNFPVGMTLELAAAVGALAAGIISKYVPEAALGICFSLVLAFSGIMMLARQDKESENPSEITAIERVNHLWTGTLLATGGGFLGVFLGVGGGIIKNPIMYLVLRLHLKEAVATSTYMVGITASIGVAVYLLSGRLELGLGLYCLLGTIIGAQLGSMLLRKVRLMFLKYMILIVMLYAAGRMFIDYA